MPLSGERGSVLLLVLIVMMVLIILGTALISLSLADLNQSLQQEQKTGAYYLARSGADAVATYIINHPHELSDFLNLGVDEVSFEKGRFEVKVTKQGDQILINSTGFYGRQIETVSLTLLTVSQGLTPDMAVFSLAGMTMKDKAEISSGGTNSILPGSVSFYDSARVNGDFYIGLGGDPWQVINKPLPPHINKPVINLPRARQYTLPSFAIFPEDLPGRPTLSINNVRQSSIIDEDGHYNRVTVKNDGILTVNVGSGVRRIRINRLVLENDARVLISGTGTLNLYVEEEVTMKNNAVVHKDGDPDQILIFYRGTETLNLQNNSHLSGSIYSVTADVTVKDNFVMTGGIIAGGSGKVTLHNSSTVSIIYAPDAGVELSNDSTVTGAVVCKSFMAANNSRVIFNPAINWGKMIFGEQTSVFKTGHWNRK